MRYIDMLTLALKDCGNLGIGQSPNAEDINDAQTTLGMMLDAWKLERLNVYHFVDVAFPATGAASYTIGVGGDINVARPNAIESAFVRQMTNPANPIDAPLSVIRSRDDWNLITAKSVGSYPSMLFYDAAFPLGIVNVWPIPAAGVYEIHLTLKGDWSSSPALTDVISFPPGYLEAIRYNLAIRLAIMYQVPMTPELVSAARTSLAAIQRSNAMIPELRAPLALQRRQNRFNVFTGQ